MTVNAHRSTKGEQSQLAINSEINTEINSNPHPTRRSAVEIKTLIDEIRATGTWWAQQAGDIQHRYVFCWRWREPSTPILFVYSRAHWLTTRARWEKALGLT